MAQSQSRDNLQDQLSNVRESVESIWIAIILAFVLRAFILEAFVIPTGSMAPRLMGQHWQFDCPACGYHYAFGLTTEGSGLLPNLSEPVASGPSGNGPPAVCPNCLYRNYFSKAWAYNGDRVLVLKYLYSFRDPASWEVVVFKNPQDNEQNFIKRLIGLPGEMIQIVHGDVYYRQLTQDLNGDGVLDGKDFADARSYDQAPWAIMRKPAATQDVMWQVIFENDYQPDEKLYQGKGNEKWTQPWQAAKDTQGWDLNADKHRVFTFAGSPKPQEIHFEAERNRFAPNYAYNEWDRGSYGKDDISSDLKLSFMFVPKAADSRVGLHLSSFQHHFRATLAADGTCVLEHGLESAEGAVKWDAQPWAKDMLNEPLKVDQSYNVALVHVDHQAQFWVDGKIRLQSTDSQYPSDMQQAIEEEAAGVPTPEVAVSAEGGPSELHHVALMRDVYYTNATVLDVGNNSIGAGWGTMGRPIILRKFLNNPDMDEFFMLGDNSPRSKDSRMWGYHSPTLREGYREGTVPRYSLIGRAFFVYWPGGFRPPFLEKLPIVPNVGRMRLIR